MINKRAAEKRRHELESKEKETLLEQRNLQDKSKYLQTGLECEAAYQKRREKIWIDDLQGIQQKLKERIIIYERFVRSTKRYMTEIISRFTLKKEN